MASARRVALGVPTPVEAAIGLPACPDCKASRGDPCRTPGDKTRHPHAGRYRLAKMQGIVPWFERGGAQ